jgi:hypothetical protein
VKGPNFIMCSVILCFNFCLDSVITFESARIFIEYLTSLISTQISNLWLCCRLLVEGLSIADDRYWYDDRYIRFCGWVDGQMTHFK